MAKETFEDRLERLKLVVEKLERGDLPLEEGVALYKEGLELVKACGKQLETARHDVKIVSEGLVREFDALESLAADPEEA
ncbi:exodeoxyribonuclease VII small subunit [Pseudodesulfovibrio sp. S3]|uniref:exodeoxyribonuclease VII small subunit n=1 Tax=unclassified Pseudodesulfovibrio TaxID=2661612 RepID=UPI000FEC04D4|nr:exodeoxyribonuclease VII small subunit [Pseudodesulfovibrio sp. S3]MCJ2164486.1 exodeoxyribonuclease VII small subunit [Pseudodesulfovibrio sp. S3-i]RWU04686.1 exodeoxyribonuclease VII small subunit [Pseudodesulfovibrio sp. S3]